MTDETEDEEIDLGEIEVETDGESEYIECEKGQVIFPYGCAWYADTHGFNSIFVEYKTGAITGEDNSTGLMRSPNRKPGQVTAIK